MFLFQVSFETPRGHYMHVVITADDPTHAKCMVEEMLREFGEEVILSGKTYQPEHFVTWLLAD